MAKAVAGTVCPPPCFLKTAMYTTKICHRNELVSRAAILARPVVFTNGVFDLLHRGHVECLEAARRLGASLIVGINSDRSVKTLGKGPGRPLNCADDRMAVIAALQCVSLAVVFEEPTPMALLADLKPNIYAKGGDYNICTLREAELMQQWGGRTVILDYVKGRSTTHLIERAHQIHTMERAL